MPEIFEGRTIEVFGPQDFSYKELAGFVYDITGQTPSIIDMPKEMLKKIAEILPRQRQPMLTRGLVEQWSEDVVASMTADEYAAQAKNPDGILTLATLGFRATPIEKIAFSYLHRFRRGGHFLITEGYHSNK